jgi:hypothetical protein
MPPITVTSPASGSLDFTYAHGLGQAPDNVGITMTSAGMIWLDGTTAWDATYVYLHASDYNLTALLEVNGLAAPVAGGYCGITDVTHAFPSFQRNATNSVQDSQIQSWIVQHAARIDAALIQRGFDPQNPPVPLTSRQISWLQVLNADAAIGELGRALEGNITLQPGEISLVGGRRKNYETVLADIRLGRFDQFFGLKSRMWGSMAGAETDKSTPYSREENRAFGRNQKF